MLLGVCKIEHQYKSVQDIIYLTTLELLKGCDKGVVFYPHCLIYVYSRPDKGMQIRNTDWNCYQSVSISRMDWKGTILSTLLHADDQKSEDDLRRARAHFGKNREELQRWSSSRRS